MRELGLLRLLQRHVLARPVGAAVLHVLAVEHQLVELVADVVVVRHVAPGAARPVERVQEEGEAPPDPARQARRHQPVPALPRIVRLDELDERHHVAALDHDAPVHVGLAGAEPRIEQQVARDLVVGEAKGDLRKALGRFPERGPLARGVGDLQQAALDQPGKPAIQQSLAHGSPLPAIRRPVPGATPAAPRFRAVARFPRT